MNARLIWLTLLLLPLLGACVAGQPAHSPVESGTTNAPTSSKITPTRPPQCTVVTNRALPTPARGPQVPPVGENEWMRGSPEAEITLLFYSDFQCPGCAAVAPLLTRLVSNHPQVKVVYRHYPLLPIHDKAAQAAQAAEAAGAQGKFWAMHDLLFSRRDEWVTLSAADFDAWLEMRAADLELDVRRFNDERNSPAMAEAIRQAYEQNLALQMPGTPYLLINGNPYEGPLRYGDLEVVIALLALEKRQFDTCPPFTIDLSHQYWARLATEKGEVTLELLAEKAPLAVNNFVFLARQKWYDGVTFHRVIPGFVAQAGDPSGTGLGGPGYAFDNEISDLRFDQPGLVGMANAGPGTNGSQFFITYSALPHLDGLFTIFGRVLTGMEVLLALTPRDPSQSLDLPPGDRILSVEIIEK